MIVHFKYNIGEKVSVIHRSREVLCSVTDMLVNEDGKWCYLEFLDKKEDAPLSHWKLETEITGKHPGEAALLAPVSVGDDF